MPNEKTVLYGLHAELGARFTPFAGYEMPIQYRDGLRAEHLHTRSHAGLFDVSHMGQVRVTGRGLEEALERALPLDFDGWPEGVQRYSLLDRKSTRLNSSHRTISYAVFCLKKKKKKKKKQR